MRRSCLLLQRPLANLASTKASSRARLHTNALRWRAQPCRGRSRIVDSITTTTPIQHRTFAYAARRLDSSVAKPADAKSDDTARKPWRPAPHRNPDEPVYEMYFTCKVCKHRSAHTISKQGYHAGTTLVKCPGCQSRHLISDHLKIFSDKAITVEDLLAQRGEAIEKGTVDVSGDLEFWEDKATKGK